MYVFVITLKHRLTTQYPPGHRHRCVNHRKTESEKRYYNRYGSRRFLCPQHRQRGEKKAGEQRSRIAEKDRCGVEVVTKKPRERAAQHQRNDDHQRPFL